MIMKGQNGHGLLSRKTWNYPVEYSMAILIFGHVLLLFEIIWLLLEHQLVKFTYSEKVTKFCEIFTLYVVPVKSKVKILQNFVAFSEYMNFDTAIHIQTDIDLGILHVDLLKPCH